MAGSAHHLSEPPNLHQVSGLDRPSLGYWIAGFLELRQYAPRPRVTAGSVRASSLRSPQSDQFVT